MRSLLAALFVASLAIVLVVSRAQAGPGPHIRPGRIWVTFSDGGGSAALRRKAMALAGGHVIRTAPGLGGIVLEVPVGQEEALARQWAGRTDVACALPIPLVQALETPNDDRYGYQWALPQIQAPRAWDVISSSRTITIAVVDTGVDLTHPDLAGQLWTNADEIPANDVDDDGNGYVDDVHGWNVADGTNDPRDDHYHGTHVAGIAAATADNVLGVAGVSRDATIMPVRVLDRYGYGDYADVIGGILYAADNGARIINLSLGGTESYTPLQEALIYAQDRGALIVAAAGNDGAEGLLYPAAYPEAMAVAATDRSDLRASFSNHGPQLSVAAPGVGVLSTRPGGYGYLTGTSMAAPHVSGVAALVWALHTSYGPDEVRATIEGSADDVNSAEHPGWDQYLGWGRINAARAVHTETHWAWLPYVRRP